MQYRDNVKNSNNRIKERKKHDWNKLLAGARCCQGSGRIFWAALYTLCKDRNERCKENVKNSNNTGWVLLFVSYFWIIPHERSIYYLPPDKSRCRFKSQF
jgi:hypothetical protein